MSNRLSIVRGTTKSLEIDLVDENGDPLPLSQLQGATAELLVRVQPSDLTNVIRFSTKDTPVSLAFKLNVAALTLTFAPSDTAGLAVQLYFWQLQVTLATGDVLDAVPWDIFDVNLGGSATPTPPAFDNTVKIDQDYQLPNDLAYMSPGGSPIQNAQVRLYYKHDYDAGNLASPVGVTATNAAGGWINPILVVPGFSYVVRFEKPNEWGPDTKEIFA